MVRPMGMGLSTSMKGVIMLENSNMERPTGKELLTILDSSLILVNTEMGVVMAMELSRTTQREKNTRVMLSMI